MTIQVSNEPDDFFSFEHDGWEKVCAGYEQYFLPLTRQSVTPLLDAARVTTGLNLLDVCSGSGSIAAAAAERGACPVGLDFSARSLDIARRNYPAIEFHEGDVQALPFDENRFDAVICGYGIIHVPDPAIALAEMKRVLKPGARLALSVWQAPAPDNGYGLVFDAINTHAEPATALPHGPDFFQFSADGKLAAALEFSRLTDIEVDPLSQTWDLDTPARFVDCMLQGTVRTRGLLLAQSEPVRRRVLTAIAAGIEPYKSAAGGYQLPMPALVGSGAK